VRVRVATFFDMDRTVVRRNTGPLYISYAWRHGRLRKRHVAVGALWTLLYQATLLDTERAMTRAIAALEGDDDASLTDFCEVWFERDVLPIISRSARRVIELHRKRGDILVLLTASLSYTARPVAEHLGLDHVLATRLEVGPGGQLTGRLIAPFCHGDGKVYWAERFAEEHSVDLDESTFYSDSIEDMPMLSRVGHPVIVNPDFRLARLARRKSWRTERWQ
jgi:HAD superfamily hydrolase (TIGR01490 family)